MRRSSFMQLVAAISIAAAPTLVLIGCKQVGGGDTNAERAAQQATRQASTRRVHTMRNDVEGQNYVRREEIADDPTTILWCTTTFPVAGGRMITFPIVGKLTSGNKRPYATQRVVQLEAVTGTEYNPEIPGPDGMYGSSGEYRYGFTPTGAYVDFYGMPVICTTEATIYQTQQTTLVMQVDTRMQEAQTRARAALRAGHAAEASQILGDAIRTISPTTPDQH